MTLPPPIMLERQDVRPDPAESIGEILFRFECGDYDGAMCAAERMMLYIPVVVMTKEQLRSEPLSYWQLTLLAHIDGAAMLCDLLEKSDVPCAEAVRVVCELVEREVIALR